MPNDKQKDAEMPRMPVIADVHPATLEELGSPSSLWEVPKEFKPRRKAERKPKVAHIIPDPRIWTVAVKMAEKDMTRLEVRSENCVVIHNNSNWKRRNV